MISLVGGRPLTVDDILEDEYGKALSCEERTYFFASETAQKTRPQPSPPQVATSASSNSDSRFGEITLTYTNAWEILTSRITQVYAEHLKLAKIFRVLRILGIGIPDRDSDTARESIAAVAKRFSELAKGLVNAEPPEKDKATATEVESYCRIWSGLNNICQLCMEEISFLCKRIESLQNILNVIKGWCLTLVIFVASTINTRCASQKDSSKDKPENVVTVVSPSPQPGNSPPGTPGGAQAHDSDLDKKLADIQQTLNELKSTLTPDTGSKELSDIRKSIDAPEFD